MRTAFRIACVLMTMVCLAQGAWAVPPSESAKKTLVEAAAGLEKAVERPLAAWQTYKDGNKLEEIGNRYNCVDVADSMRSEYVRVVEAYHAATTNQGDGHDPWPTTDPDIAKAREQAEAVAKKLEAAGMWSAARLGERHDTFVSRLNNMYDQAWVCFLDAKHGKVDEAQKEFKMVDQRFASLKLEAERALASNDRSYDVNFLKSPAMTRFSEALAKFMKDAEPFISQAAGARDATDKDVHAFMELAKKYHEVISNIETKGNLSGSEEEALKRVEEMAVAIEAFEKNDLPGLQKTIDDFKAKYGATSEEIEKKLNEIKGGRHDYNSPGYQFDELQKKIARVKEVRVNMGGQLLESAESEYANSSSFAENIRVKRLEVAKNKLTLAVRLDAGNEKAKQLLAGADAQIASLSAAIEKDIDNREFQGHASSFDGPGNADELAAIAAKYLIKEGWTTNPPRDLLAVRVAGSWRDGDKNLLGEYINYQLGFEAAFHLKTDKEAGKDLARVYYISLYTESRKKEPPFSKSGVGDNYFVRASKVRGIGGSAPTTGSGSGSMAGGGLGSLFWLALVVANLVAGLLAAAPLLNAKAPQLNALYHTITPMRNVLGVAALAIGLLCFVRALILYFAPLADLLPQLAAVVTGLFLGKELLLKKPAETPAPEAPPAAPVAEGAAPAAGP
ncbi:MAG TPA: hypothetical protein PKO06_10230, partial [Candidatus Ozemobacteraceae bacterium]|nr:hypothetical protein [Candidatus Ozemobacteraceae bacterium]